MERYAEIPPLDPSCTILPVKTFAIEERWTATAIMNAVLDLDEIRDGYLFTCLEQTCDVVQIPGKAILDLAAKGVLLCPYGVELIMAGPGFRLGLIDVVTYPFFFALIHGVDLAKDPQALLKINHNLVAPYIDHLGGLMSVLTISHTHERPIDDAPTHNLISLSSGAVTVAVQKIAHLGQKEAYEAVVEMISRELDALVAMSPNIVWVHGEDPVMDDRYVMMERRPCDGEKKRLPRF